MRYADRQGLVLAMLPAWGYYVKEARTLTKANARAYGRWLGQRYEDAPNVVWVNGGDRTPTGFEDVFRELARGPPTGNLTGATFPEARTQFFKTPDFWEDAVLLLEGVEDQASKRL